MSGSTRDLAVVDHWNDSLQRSLERRARASRGFARRNRSAGKDDRIDCSQRPPGDAPRPGRRTALAAVARTFPRSPQGRGAALRPRELTRQARFRWGHSRPSPSPPPPASQAGRRRSPGRARTPSRRRPPSTRSCSASAAKAGRCGCSSRPWAGSKWTGSSAPKRKPRFATSRPGAGCQVDGVVGSMTASALRGEASGSTLTSEVQTVLPGQPTATTAAARATADGARKQLQRRHQQRYRRQRSPCRSRQRSPC